MLVSLFDLNVCLVHLRCIFVECVFSAIILRECVCNDLLTDRIWRCDVVFVCFSVDLEVCDFMNSCYARSSGCRCWCDLGLFTMLANSNFRVVAIVVLVVCAMSMCPDMCVFVQIHVCAARTSFLHVRSALAGCMCCVYW